MKNSRTTTRPLGFYDTIEEFRASQYLFTQARQPWQQKQAMDLRQSVFSDEQKIFKSSDRDLKDESCILLVAMNHIAGSLGSVRGTVRIIEEEPNVWSGSRLAVCKSDRKNSIVGAGLIRLAVSTANALGCKRFVAEIQAQNYPLFRKLRWEKKGELNIYGRSHYQVEADLNYYPPLKDLNRGFMLLRNRSLGLAKVS